jgi:branched-subunit amino acid transport protein
MQLFYLIAGMALVTFLIRYTMFALGERAKFPDLLVRALRYVPPTVLTAITVPAVLMPGGDKLELSYTNAYLIGAIVACAVGWFSQNLLLTIVVGMLTFLGWQWVLAVGLI